MDKNSDVENIERKSTNKATIMGKRERMRQSSTEMKEK